MGGSFEKGWKKYTPAGLLYTGAKKVMGTDDKPNVAAAAASVDSNPITLSSRDSILGSLTNADGSPLKRDSLFGN